MIRKNKSSHDDDDEQPKHDSDDNLFIDLPVNQYQTSASFVMIFNQNIPLETKKWLISLLKSNHLQLSIITDSNNRYIRSSSSTRIPEDLTLLISCSEKLFEQNVHNVFKQLKRQNLMTDKSLDDSKTSTSTKLNTAEKQRILYQLIQQICSPNRTSIIGLPDITLYPGQSIFEICCHHKLITHYFPLHDYEHLENLRSNYCSFFSHNIGKY